MLDYFAIFTRGGLVLWTFQLTALKGNPINALIQTCLLQERSGQTSFQVGKDSAAYTLKWTFHNELGLVFVAVYQRILQLLYVDDLLSCVKNEFSVVYDPARYTYPTFNDTFNQLLREAEERAQQLKRPKQISNYGGKGGRPPIPAKKGSNGVKKIAASSEDDGDSDSSGKGDVSSVSEVEVTGEDGLSEKEKNDSAFDVSKLKKKGDKGKGSNSGSGKSRNIFGMNVKQQKSDDLPKKGKQNRVWDDTPVNVKQDFSDPSDRENIETVDVKKAERSLVDQEEENFELEEEFSPKVANKSKGKIDSSVPPKRSWLSSIFQSVAGKSSLEKYDLEPALKQLKERLMSKNVAEEIADKLCESVSSSIEGKKQASFTRISTVVQSAMEEALVRIMTPKRSIDILRDVHAAKEQKRPYVIVFIGVNGVGKSTNLSKVAYWLLQHDVRLMLAACDTFRAGAVEQLRTHSKRLGVPLFERGYEKDPAAVAKEAIKEATKQGLDAVLVDTAGRMQDNEPLMRALSKLINLNEPDLIMFVGEALVGNDAVDQLTKFNQRLADLSTGEEPRSIDGILLTKFDTIDDKVGAALSMVYTSGAPIMFVGCGQTYTDLKKLQVKQIVKSLLN